MLKVSHTLFGSNIKALLLRYYRYLCEVTCSWSWTRFRDTTRLFSLSVSESPRVPAYICRRADTTESRHSLHCLKLHASSFPKKHNQDVLRLKHISCLICGLFANIVLVICWSHTPPILAAVMHVSWDSAEESSFTWPAWIQWDFKDKDVGRSEWSLKV